MEITEVRVRLTSRRNDKLRAFCSVTLDNSLVIRDLKIIEGSKGAFVAMPSRKVADRCGQCGMKNHLRAKFCNECGVRLPEDRAPRDPQGRVKLHADIAHPISSPAREALQRRILEAYGKEVERSKLPGYAPVALPGDSDDPDLDGAV